MAEIHQLTVDYHHESFWRVLAHILRAKESAT